MKRRRRRSSKEVKKIQERFLEAVQREGRISLTDLISKYGPELDVRNTPSDKNLVKRQLDQLDRNGEIDFRREGRELIAHRKVEETAPEETLAAEAASPPPPTPPDLAVIKTFALQLGEFAKSLHEQIETLVRMVENVETR